MRGCKGAAGWIVAGGAAHERGDRPSRGALRDAWFAARGLLTVRLAASDVLDDPDATVRHLVTLAATRTAGAQ
ncbi:hypothetical protein [Sphingomonas sp. BK580]|uniref:hypothetical protein n=1 Tax=Sphingomonas sp. BK580 TaxID=2586972 RepID=UPI001619B420|nr:hypothetical protein [Sphingomonas sp. BK580]MBB3695146.1 very-short-patch-repair endonuclease [Sphingomonas sp. BK580]